MKYGSVDVATKICDAKESDQEARLTQVRKHPDLGKTAEDDPDP